MNKYDFELDCSIFEYSNITTDNLVVSYRFSNETVPRKSNPDKIGDLNLYTDDFNMSKLIVNRTD